MDGMGRGGGAGGGAGRKDLLLKLDEVSQNGRVSASKRPKGTDARPAIEALLLNEAK